MLSRNALALLALVGVACATTRPGHPQTTRPTPAQPPRRPTLAEATFSCEATERRRPAPRIVTTAAGETRLELALLGPRPRPELVPDARLRVVALQAAAGALGLELGRVLGRPVTVSPAAAQARVTMAGEMTFTEMAAHVRVHGLALAIERPGLVLRITTTLESVASVECTPGYEAPDERSMLAPIELRLIPVPEGLEPAALAAAFCRQIATRDGRASVVGRALLVADRGPTAVSQLERLITELEAMRHARVETPPTPAVVRPDAAPARR